MIAIWRREQWGEFQKVKQKESSLGADEIQFECETLECAVIFFFFFWTLLMTLRTITKTLIRCHRRRCRPSKLACLCKRALRHASCGSCSRNIFDDSLSSALRQIRIIIRWGAVECHQWHSIRQKSVMSHFIFSAVTIAAFASLQFTFSQRKELHTPKMAQ